MNDSRRKTTSTLGWRIGVLISWAALAVPAHAAGPIVILIGPPASGRTTQAEILKKERGMAIISARDLIAHNQQMFQRFRNPTIQGVDPEADPALNKLVEEALEKVDLSKGVVLVGYPAAKTQGDYLAGLREKLSLPKAIVIHLHVPDEVSRKRLEKQPVADLEQQLKNYHRELELARTYFPEADIRDVDGTKTIPEVAKEIRKLLETPKN